MAFLLDLELRRPCPDNLTSLDAIVAVADGLKAKENQEFEDSITDAARKLFQ